MKFRRRGITQKKVYNELYLTCTYNRLPEDEPWGLKHVEDNVKIKVKFEIFV